MVVFHLALQVSQTIKGFNVSVVFVVLCRDTLRSLRSVFYVLLHRFVSSFSGRSVQEDVGQSGSLLLVEERQADRGPRGGRPHRRRHHRPAGHRSHSHQRPRDFYSPSHHH